MLHLSYSLSDKKPTENPAAISREALMLQKKLIVAQLLCSEPEKTTINYLKEVLRFFVSHQYD